MPFPFANVLWAVSERLIDRKNQIAAVVFVDTSIYAITPAGAEFDAE